MYKLYLFAEGIGLKLPGKVKNKNVSPNDSLTIVQMGEMSILSMSFMMFCNSS